jgi:hypothetical protein
MTKTLVLISILSLALAIDPSLRALKTSGSVLLSNRLTQNPEQLISCEVQFRRKALR